MRKRLAIILLSLIVVSLVLTACAPGSRWDSSRKAGFLWGIWHGWIAPVSLVWQIFNPAVRVYETNNTGWWYDFGFYIAIIGGFGGLAFFRKKD